MTALLAFVRAALGRAFRIVRDTFGPTGRFVVVSAAVAFALWAWRGWAEFGFLALTLSASLVAALPWVLGRARYEVSLTLTPRRVSAGETARLVVAVRNVDVRPLRAVRMEVGMTGRDPLRVDVDRLGPQETDEPHTRELEFPRRGVVVAGPVVSVRGDELQLLRRTVRWTGRHELVVHPATVRVRTSVAGLVHDLEGVTSRAITSSDLEFHALRVYEPSDDPRFIHWGASARASTSPAPTLMMRQFEQTRRSRILVLLATDERWYADDDEFELAVSVAASLGRKVIDDGTGLTVATEDGPLDTRSRNRFLDETARVIHTPRRGVGLRRLVAEATASLPDLSVAILIGGSPLLPAVAQSIVSQFPSDTRLVGIRCAPGQTESVVGSRMRIVRLPALDDLRRLVERVS